MSIKINQYIYINKLKEEQLIEYKKSFELLNENYTKLKVKMFALLINKNASI
jgi:hypothetical protein